MTALTDGCTVVIAFENGRQIQATLTYTGRTHDGVEQWQAVPISDADTSRTYYTQLLPPT